MIDGGLRKLFVENLPRSHLQSMEVGAIGRGVPDLNGCSGGREFWIELKKTAHWTVRVRPEQVAWIERRMRNGGRCFVAIRRWNSSGVDQLWLLGGSTIRGLRDGRRLTDFTSLGTWDGGPARWNWDEVLEGVMR